MFTYKGGHRVGTGTYWNLDNGRRVDVAEESILPGNVAAMYVRAPSVVMVLAGPVLGLLYVLVLPFIGIVTTAVLAVSKVLGSMSGMVEKSISFGWRPKTAYLSGKEKKEQGKK